MAEFSLQALAAEITNDPQGIGYKNPDTTWKGDQEIADLLNDPANGGQITRKLIQPKEIFDSIPYAEYSAYPAAKREWLDTVLELVGGEGVIDANDSVVNANLLAVFPAGSAARTNILAKIQRQGSRAEVLWGEGRIITASNVGHAANV